MRGYIIKPKSSQHKSTKQTHHTIIPQMFFFIQIPPSVLILHKKQHGIKDKKIKRFGT
eukprot:UN09178